jgi:hypothetical protein
MCCSIERCHGCGHLAVIVETDSANLVTTLQSTYFDEAPAGVIFHEARSLKELHFTLRGIVFVPHTCNQCVHEFGGL